MIRAALYARYSSDLQSARSVADQLALLTREAAARGWEVEATYADEAISGASMITRPGLQAMLADAAGGRFQIVLAEALDRLSRDQADTAIIHRALAFAEVRIVTLSEQDVTPLHVGFKGLMNALFLSELGAKTRRGLEARVRDGAFAGGRTYGYCIPAKGQLAIDPAESEIVREIHRRYAAGEAPRTITADLNRRGVPGPRDGLWQASAIAGQPKHGNGILNNELYIGRVIWNRRRKVTDPVTGKKRMRENPPEKWVHREMPELAILTPEEWAATRAMREKMTRATGGARRRPSRPLSGLIRCAACGGPMILVSAGRYGCSHRRERGTCSESRTIAAKVIEARVFEALSDLLTRPGDIEETARAWQAARNNAQEGRRKRRQRLEADAARLANQITRCVDLIVDGHANAALMERLTKLEAEKAAIDAELSAAPSEAAAALPLPPEHFAAMTRALAEAANDPQGGDAVRRAMRRLITAIHAGWSADGAPRFVVDGTLAALLPQRKKPLDTVSGVEGFSGSGCGNRI